MTIYLELWYKVIAQPRYNKKVADRLRLAHNHLIQRRAKSNVTGEFGVDVSQLENGRATCLRVSYAEARYE